MIVFIDKPETIDPARQTLTSECVVSPHGFTVTAFAFEEFLTHNALHSKLHNLMQLLDIKKYTNLARVSNEAQLLLSKGEMPPGLRMAIIRAYKRLGINEPVVVSSHSPVVNDDKLQKDVIGCSKNDPTVCGETSVLACVQNCFAALYTTEAIRYRQNKNFVHDKAALCVTVQRMARLPGTTCFSETNLN